MTTLLDRRVWLAGALIIGLTTLPYLAGAISAPAGTRFSGVILDPLDYESHLAKMQQGARGSWLYQLLFTAEPHQPLLLQTFYVALGHISTNFDFVYQIARIVCIALMVWSIWGFVGRFLSTDVAGWALLLALFGGGLSFLLLLIPGARDLTANVSPVEFWFLDMYTFLASFASPHFAAGIALLALAFTALDSWTQGTGGLLVLFLVSIGIAFIQPFDVILIDGALVIVTLWRARCGQIKPLSALIGIVLIGIAHGAIIGYDWIALYHFPVWQSFTEQNITLSPPPIYYVLGYAPTLLPALGGIGLAVRRRDSRWLVPILWIVEVALLVYAPLASQRRFVLAVQVPIAALAVYWLANVAVPWLRTRIGQRWRSVMLAYGTLAVLSTIMLMAWLLAATRNPANTDLYIPDGTRAAWNWIAANTPPDSVILSSFASGGNIAGQTGRFVVIGHWIETANFVDKLDAVQRFFSSDTTATWRLPLLQSQRVTYIWYGDNERALGTWSPAEAGYLRPVFESPSVTIYRVADTL